MSASRRFPVILSLALLAAPALLAGCTERVDTARQELDDARSGLDEAREELSEMQQRYEDAKARYERVRSLTIVRTERADLTLVPEHDASTTRLTFAPRAERDGIAIPVANLTRLPLVAVRIVDEPFGGAPAEAGEATFACDPLSCSITVPAAGAALLGWEESGELAWQVLGNGTLLAYRNGAWEESAGDAFAFFQADAPVLATTRVGDAAS